MEVSYFMAYLAFYNDYSSVHSVHVATFVRWILTNAFMGFVRQNEKVLLEIRLETLSELMTKIG